jgi:nucleoside-diphosphate-sugar epimerase
MREARILVTGGADFNGSHLCETLLDPVRRCSASTTTIPAGDATSSI